MKGDRRWVSIVLNVKKVIAVYVAEGGLFIMVRLTLLSQIRLLFQLFQQLTSSILVVDGDLRVVGLSMRIH